MCGAMAQKQHTEIPDKLYFRIGEVSRIAELEAYVLRFWEKEFPMLRPTKAGSGQRMYRRKDLDTVLEIKKLLYQEGFTIEGARKKLRQDQRGAKQQQLAFPAADQQKLRRIRDELKDVLTVLSTPGGQNGRGAAGG